VGTTGDDSEELIMTWHLTEITEQFIPGLPPREKQCMINDDGVRIIVFGRNLNEFQTIFIYEHSDIIFEFTARQVAKRLGRL
jgi:hypothetical protein